jgi:hypothetical protein
MPISFFYLSGIPMTYKRNAENTSSYYLLSCIYLFLVQMKIYLKLILLMLHLSKSIFYDT